MPQPTATDQLPNVMLSGGYEPTMSLGDILPDVLHAVRVHLGMDVAFISEFSGGRRIFRYVDAAFDKQYVQVGASDPLDNSYCQRVIEGRLPQLMQDASRFPAALELPVTTALPIGAHISVPIQLKSGRIYGTFCCFSVTPDPTLAERDLSIMRIFAEVSATQIDRYLDLIQTRNAVIDNIIAAIETEDFTILYQPIYNCAEERIVGFEALTRFSDAAVRPPDTWFAEAARVGLGGLLEVRVIEKALEGLHQFPEAVYLSLNVSPDNILSGAIAYALKDAPLSRIVLEVTEHVSIADYSQFGTVLAPLRQQGLRLAIDDAGAGYASFRHILKLDPDLIKLDISLTQDIDTDPMCSALAAAMIRFAEETGSRIIAEGVETDSALKALQRLRVSNVQGYLLGYPVPLSQALQLCPRS
jgi:EAL domain-containing protein (putative c-di-GMP-specific phosphodiesterase class I)